jgi:hypothetical protein
LKAGKVVDFTEDFAAQNNYTAIRLDAFKPHKRVIQFYLKRNYHISGETFSLVVHNLFIVWKKQYKE